MSQSAPLSVTIKEYASEKLSTMQSKSPLTMVYGQPLLLKTQDGRTNMDPDELFTKHTIHEVKVIQQKIRAEADQKKQELRLMVGERYRDVLQSSASIISIADSSKKVLDAIDKSMAAIAHQQEPTTVKGAPSQKETDTHLHALQQLAAHVKLLIDAPENLWRLIERKKYFSAAWLFLLVRVVHKALVRDNEREEGTWRRHGIDVLSEFPLVQRQWDVISQFRPQIVHKATLSLRDIEIPPEDACAALVTLHLLDSRPLTDTFSMYLSQRTKTLTKALTHDLSKRESNTTFANGHAYAFSPAESTSFTMAASASPVQEVKEDVRMALSIVTHTVKSTRDIFEREELGRSLMYNVLKCMQPGNPEAAADSTLPPELRLSTPLVLSALPSSVALQLLPPDVKDYKPYVDLDSSSSMVSHIHLSSKLDEWLVASISELEKSFHSWLERLPSLKDVWSVRTLVWKWVSSSHMKSQEITVTLNAMDRLFNHRILGLWRAALSKAQDTFRRELSSALTSVVHHNEDNHTDSPINHLFHLSQLPQHSQLGFGSKVNIFEKHYAALRKRLLCRTRLLDTVLGALESCARVIQDDVSIMTSFGPTDTRDLVNSLIIDYRPLAQDMCETVARILGEAEETLPGDAGHGLAFLHKVVDELASSCFISLIGCSPDIAQEFRQKLQGLYDKVLDRWIDYVVSSSSLNYTRPGINAVPIDLLSSKQTGPSPELLRSLVRLSGFALQLGPTRDLAKRHILLERTLRLYISQYLRKETKSPEELRKTDAAFLQQLLKRHGEDWSDERNELSRKLDEVEAHDLETVAAEALVRVQNLIASLLSYDVPDHPPAEKQGLLLPVGIPVPDTQYQSPMSLAKPGPRLGQLLVEGSFNF